MGFPERVAAVDNAVREHLGNVTVVYQPATGEAVTLEDQVFDENYVLIEASESAVEQVTPAVWLTLADLPIDPDEDDPRLTINGTIYKVRERKRDSLGTVLLLLLRAGTA